MPKTLVFAKDDFHAEDIVRLAREEFGEGNEFCQKITYRTGFTKVPTTVKDEDGAARPSRSSRRATRSVLAVPRATGDAPARAWRWG